MILSRLAVCSLIFVTGCSQFKTAPLTNPMDPAFMTSGGTELVPESDRMANDCASNPSYDACIVFKNPTAQKSAAVSAVELSPLFQYGVKLRGLLASGNLENSRFQILTLHTSPLSLLRKGALKVEFSESNSFVEQRMAYYWSNRTFEYLSARLGEERLPVKGLKIYVDDSFTGLSVLGHAISLTKKPGEIPKALSAEILIQLIGQDIAFELSGKKSFDLNSTAQHKFCDLNPKGCCASEIGCANALNSAFGDYIAGMMFPDSPKLGETVANAVSGQNICGLSRDLAQLHATTRSSVYASCPSATQGKVALEGAWYASLWWKFRLRAEALESGASRDVDVLFFEHARSWTASSTFLDAKQTALALATGYKGGKFSALLQNVFDAAEL